MKTTAATLAALLLTLSGCATPVPVSCPPPPPVPLVLSSPASTEPSLLMRYEPIEKALSDSLEKAQRP
jgi:hypothetical protein